MNQAFFFALLQAAIQTVAVATPAIINQHWNGNGPNGKLNNALQILKDFGAVGSTFGESFANSSAVQNVHPELQQHAEAIADIHATNATDTATQGEKNARDAAP